MCVIIYLLDICLALDIYAYVNTRVLYDTYVCVL